MLRAVQDVSLEIAPGEFFGIVGRNGSGKSTLLKCLAGIYDIDSGELEINGRLSPFIELGVGFNMDLTARDNVIINAIMLGLSRKQARERFDDIIAFAELEDFIDLKLKNYSSGMYVRLAFATAVQVDADILLIDEVLAVGDANFQQKCFDEFTRLQRRGRTILFVTHDMGSVERFCDRAMLLEHGRVVDIGEPELDRPPVQPAELPARRARRPGPPRPSSRPRTRLPRCSTPSSSGPTARPPSPRRRASRAASACEVRFAEDVEDPIFAISLLNESGHPVFATNTDSQRMHHGPLRGRQPALVRAPLRQLARPRALPADRDRGASGTRRRHLRRPHDQLDHRARRPAGRRHDRPPAHAADRARLISPGPPGPPAARRDAR